MPTISEGMSRVFFALPIGQDEMRAIGRLAEKLKSKFDDARWVEPANYHLTLHFIGEVLKTDVPAIADAASQVAQRFENGELIFNSLGYFGTPKYPRVIFLNAIASQDDLGRLEKLANELSAAIAGYGNPDCKKFTPHLTLARFARLRPGAHPSASNEKRLKEIEDYRPGHAEPKSDWLVFEPVSCLIERVVLYESIFTGGGVKYAELKSWPLENHTAA